MAGLNAEASLVKLLMTVANAENNIELCRKALSFEVSFKPYTVFQKLCNYSDCGLTADRLSNFTKGDREINYKKEYGLRECIPFDYERGCKLLINDYDFDCDEKWSYKEFLEFVLPVTDSKLRTAVAQKDNEYMELLTVLPKKVEYKLFILIMKAIYYLEIIEKMKMNLILEKNFDCFYLFNCIDRKKQGYIDFVSLENYLTKRGAGAKPESIASIIKKLEIGRAHV